MPIGAAIGTAAVSVGGAVLGASATNNAADTAADAQRDASAANTALARETYAQNAQRLDPYAANGMTAGNAIMSILGFGGGPGGGGTPAVDPAIADDEWATQALQALAAEVNPSIMARVSNIQDPTERLAALEPLLQRVDRQAYGQFMARNPRHTAANAQFTAPMASGNAMAAFDTFRNSSAYDWRLSQGIKAQQQGMGALGAFDSGATRKALTEYGQNFGSNELGNWMDRLSQQQGFGLGAASALAGVSQNMAGSVMNSNNQAASATGNAALIRGAANQNMYGQIAGALGGLASSFPHG